MSDESVSLPDWPTLFAGAGMDALRQKIAL